MIIINDILCSYLIDDGLSENTSYDKTENKKNTHQNQPASKLNSR